jgi:trehalose-phosphatase
MKEILRGIERGERILLFLDYDGTLVPIRKTPARAVFPSSKRDVLEGLSRRACVGIVSGRSLSEIQRLVAVKDIGYIGNHGLEISCGRRCWVHPRAKRTEPLLREALKKIRRAAGQFPGVFVEDKGVTGAVHYRLAARAVWAPLQEIVGREVERAGRTLTMSKGKRVFEIKPNVPWDKGQGVLKLLDWLHPEGKFRVVYIGDDRTDEDAFKAVNLSGRGAVTIHVGRTEKTRARYRLGTVGEVWTLLRALPSSPVSFQYRLFRGH